MRRIFVILLLALSVGAVGAQTLRFANAFSDGAVLQHSSTVKVWGWDVPDRELLVECSWIDAQLLTNTDQYGRWIVEIETLGASFTEYSITVSSSTQSLTIDDILFGEVWLCSGQSNMEMRMGDDPQWDLYVEGATEEIARSQNSHLRYLTVKRDEQFTPQSDAATTGWVEFSPESTEWVSAVGYFFSKELYSELDVPVGIIVNAYGGTPVEAWIPREYATSGIYSAQIENLNAQFSSGAQRPYYKSLSAMYNAMAHPVVDYTIRGWLWYQGEENVGRAFDYAEKFEDMVDAWREVWGDKSLPFYFVQIAPWIYHGDQAGQWSALALAQQRAADQVENCEMVVAADLGDPYNIHPGRKREVGERLAAVALNRTYGREDIAYRSPRAYSAKLVNYYKDVVVEFSDSSGLELRGSKVEFEYFDSSYNQYIRAEKVTLKDGKIVVRCGKGAEPTRLRYCWSGGSSSNIFNEAGLPVAPFEITVE